ASLSRLLTTTYATRVNAQIVAPAKAVVVKPDKLEWVLTLPLDAAINEPYRHPSYLVAVLSYHIIRSRPFLEGNQRTGFFLGNEYLRAQGFPGLIKFEKGGEVYGDVHAVVE
ncbi:hypothetical protein K435DRAFT_606362, partial [Dendrothele bispora CBS 962.96]